MNALLLVLLVTSPLAAPPSADAHRGGTLAVLPFKNLNADPSLDWLKLGVAETMVSDLKAARRSVVERDQIERALAELALQKESLSDESRAARAGRLVGATHVVVGGFQRADQQLRITARLVAVETGVVESTAKVTGDLEDIFGLQDAMVGQLLKLPDAKRRPKPKKPAQTLEAYHLYSLSLVTPSDAKKEEHLRRALDLDPELQYAIADLRALESRLNRYAKKSRAVVDERTKTMLAFVDNSENPLADRHMQAVQAMGALMGQFRYGALLDVAIHLEELRLEPAGMMNAREYASYYTFLSLMMLKRTALALQAGERHLQQYPGGVFASGLDLQMRGMIEQGHRHVQAMKDGARDLEALEHDEREAVKDAAERGKPMAPVLGRSFDFRHCSVLVSAERWPEAIESCRGFANAYKNSDDGDNLAKLARYLMIRCYTELGQFNEANDEALRLLDEFPDWSHQNSLEIQRKTWPQP